MMHGKQISMLLRCQNYEAFEVDKNLSQGERSTGRIHQVAEGNLIFTFCRKTYLREGKTLLCRSNLLHG